jgi:acetyltransferase-like isoleucine patch superfamily enzyme
VADNVVSRAWTAVGRRFSERRRARLVAARTTRDLTPPPASAFGAFGAGSVIVPPARVTTPGAIYLGAGVVIHEHAWISVVRALAGFTPKLTIGDGTQIGRFCHIACVGEIEIAEDVLIAERVFIGDTYHRYDDVTRPVIEQPMAEPRKVSIGRGAHLGVGAIVLPGVTIGEQALVGAGAVVTADVAPRSVVVGNPAAEISRFDDSSDQWIGRSDVTDPRRASEAN